MNIIIIIIGMCIIIALSIIINYYYLKFVELKFKIITYENKANRQLNEIELYKKIYTIQSETFDKIVDLNKNSILFPKDKVLEYIRDCDFQINQYKQITGYKINNYKIKD
jgi:hypothetical protein